MSNIPQNKELAEISQLAEMFLHAEQRVEAAEAELVSAKENLRRIQEMLLPEAMMAAQVEKFTTQAGVMVSVGRFYSAKIPEGRELEAFSWLRDNNFADIIKRKVECTFGKGEDNKAEKVIQHLMTLGYPYADKQNVHPMTLKSFVKEQIEAGNPFPQDLFGVFMGNRAKVTPAKNK